MSFHREQYRLKRAVDILFVICTVPVTLPLLLLIMLLKKILDGGSIFYTDNRLGLDGSPLNVYKFRTMHENAAKNLDDILDSSPKEALEWEYKQKLSKDPRVTAIGKILRKTSLDELPQIFNVLKGEMSLVGPRPIRQEEIAKYGDCYTMLKSAKPGMTGLWQVSGRSTLSYAERIKLDMTYIENCSLKLDMTILLKTIPEVLLGRGAY